MKRVGHFVLIQEPKELPFYVYCADVDECLEVVDAETKRSQVGTRVTMIKEQPTQRFPRLLGMWRVHKTGPRRYQINAQQMEDMINSARNAYLYGELDREEVIAYLMDEHGASKEDAVLASAAGSVLVREYQSNFFLGTDPKWKAWAEKLRKGSVVEFGGNRATLVTTPSPKSAPAEDRITRLKIAGSKPFAMEVGRMGPYKP